MFLPKRPGDTSRNKVESENIQYKPTQSSTFKRIKKEIHAIMVHGKGILKPTERAPSGQTRTGQQQHQVV